ncbi:hypothetical protein [Pseudomonas sp. PB3P13]
MNAVKLAALIIFMLSSKTVYSETFSCGSLGGVQFLVPDEYTFFPMEPTGGIWGEKTTGQNRTNCQRSIQAVTLEYYFPSMLPAKGFNVFNDPNKSHVEVEIVKITGVGPRTLVSRVNRYSEQMRQLGPVTEIHIGDYHGLAGIDPVYKKGQIDFYWKGKDELVTETLLCRRPSLAANATGTCNLTYFFSTTPASVTIVFSSHLVVHVENLKSSAMQIIKKFTN